MYIYIYIYYVNLGVIRSDKWKDKQYNGSWKNPKGKTMIYKALHRRLEIEQKEPLKSKVDSGDTVMK
jgi:hypothetical protein